MWSEERFISGSKRSRWEIFADILGFCVVPQTRARVMSKLGLSFKVSTDCIVQLKWFGLLRDSVDSKKKYVTSEKGLLFLKRLWRLLELLNLEHKHKKRLVHRVNDKFYVFPDTATY